jgi:hypothetical protein
MVIAEKWAEQRVLMRSYAESRDQTRPTIVLHGEELAIGPAGLDVHGPWGIHVSPGAEGRAQELAGLLESSARRLAGSKGSPPRLLDEGQTFDREPTGNWGPGAPALPQGARPSGRTRRATSSGLSGLVPPVDPVATRLPPMPAATPVAAPKSAQRYAVSAQPPQMLGRVPSNPDQRSIPIPMVQQSSGEPARDRTVLGYQSGAGAQSAIVRLGLAPMVSARMPHLAAHVVPADFQVSKIEREVLNVIGTKGVITARAIGHLVHVADPVGWMEHFMRRLESFGLDLIEPGDDHGGEPTYKLR